MVAAVDRRTYPPARWGRRTMGAPVLTLMTIVWFGGTQDPAPGLVPMTWPCGTRPLAPSCEVDVLETLVLQDGLSLSFRCRPLRKGPGWWPVYPTSWRFAR